MLAFESVKAATSPPPALLDGVGDRGIVGIAKPILGAWITFGAGEPDGARRRSPNPASATTASVPSASTTRR